MKIDLGYWRKHADLHGYIVDTFATWLPFVELREINIDLAEQDQNKINIKIVFNIKRAPNTIESVGVVLE